MTVAIVGAVLVAAPAVTSLVPAARIQAIRRTQSYPVPGITLTSVVETPFEHLRSSAGLNLSQMQVDCYGVTYTQALEIAVAVREALEAAGHVFRNQIERNEPETDPELFLITQTWSVYST